MEIIRMNEDGTIIPFPYGEKGILLMINDGNGSMSATIPGPYYSLPDRVMPGASPVPSPEQEMKPTPSIDPYVSEKDRYTVSYLPEEGKRQFRENIHQYIGQLGKDYLPQQPNEANNAAS